MPHNYWLAFIAILCIGLSWAGTERAEEQIQHEFYCEMIEIYKESGGDHGHPDDGRECGE